MRDVLNTIAENPRLWLSIGLQMIPVLGDVYSVLTGAIGYDPIAGITLSSEERWLAAAGGLLPLGGLHLLGRLGKVLPEVGALSRLRHFADDVLRGIRRFGGEVLRAVRTVGAGVLRVVRTVGGAASNTLRALYSAPQLPHALTVGRNAEEGVSVYRGVAGSDELYSGITNDLSRRAREHQDRFVRLIDLTEGEPVTRGQARAIEQALINRARGQNLRNEISPRHAWYQQAIDWGESWLTQHGI